MSLLEKIKKIFSKKPVIQKELLSFEQLPSKLGGELMKNSEKKQSIKKIIEERLASFILEIENNLKTLQETNIDSRKEVERIKIVVKENLERYISHLDKFLANLRNIEDLEVENYIKKINQILLTFKISSRNSFEKATILIGKELGDVKDTINKFIADLNNIVDENKNTLEYTLKINKIKDSFQKSYELDSSQNQLDKNLTSLAEKTDKIRKELEKTEEKIKDIKNSSDYQKSLQEKEEINRKKEELEAEIYNLKEKIDLKSLSKHFHTDEKKARIIKKYAENFKLALEEDKNFELIKLVKEAKNIDIELDEIKEKIQKLKVFKLSEVDTNLESLEQEKQRLKSGLISKELEITQETKKKDRLNKKKESLIEEIKNQAKSMFNIEIS